MFSSFIVFVLDNIMMQSAYQCKHKKQEKLKNTDNKEFQQFGCLRKISE